MAALDSGKPVEGGEGLGKEGEALGAMRIVMAGATSLLLGRAGAWEGVRWVTGTVGCYLIVLKLR